MWVIANALRVAVEPRTHLGLLFLLSRVTVGMLYAILLLVGVTFSLSTLGLGVPLVLIVLLAARRCIVFEQALGGWWIGSEVRPMSSPWSRDLSIWRRAWALATDRVTWKGVAYLALQLPLGLAASTVLSALLALALALVAAPVLYLLDAGLAGGGIEYQTFWMKASLAPFDTLAFLELVPLVPVGLAVAVATLLLSRWGVAGWRLLIGGLLGMSRAQEELLAARAEAAAEHARAERSEQRRRELIVNVSHELRNPIASIRGHVDSLLHTDPADRRSDAERARYLEVMARETERLGSLVDDLMAVARADAGELAVDVAPVSVGEVAEHVHATLAPIARRERQVTLVHERAPRAPLALADRDRLSQVLTNLVRNAITHTPEGGLVAIRLAAAGEDRVAVSVEDTGAGIAPDELERVFDRFYRTDGSRSRATGGFGLGLSICRDLVEAMGGDISVESEPGRGSRFTVLLRRAS